MNLSKKDQLTIEAYEAFKNNVRDISWEVKDGVITKHPKGAHNGDIDAFRHAYVSGIMAMEYGENAANALG